MRAPLARPIGVLALVLLLAGFCSAAPKQRGAVKQTAINYSVLRAGHKAMAAVVVEIADGFHAQSHTPLDPNLIPYVVKMDASPAITFGQPEYPPGEVEDYPGLGKLSVYTGRVVVRIPFEVNADAKPGPIEISGRVRYQVCDNNACYPPEQPKFTIKTQIVPADAAVKPNEPELFKGAAATTQPAPAAAPGGPSVGPGGSPPIQFAGQTLAPDARLLAFLTAFLVGIIFNVMPCVLPVLPLKIMGFYQAAQHSRSKSLAFGTVFSLGLIATFAAFGLLIFVFHKTDWGGFFTKSWFIALMVLILLGMALSTFGWFTVMVPKSLSSISPRHDTYWGNFLFGILTALLSTPCTFGMFVVLLAWAISQPTIIGVLILVTVGAGMAFPYFILSALPEVARRFPRTGPLGDLVKQMMGFLLLVVAVYFARPFIGRIVPGEIFWWIPFGVIVAAALYLIIRTFQLSRTAVPRLVSIGLSLILVLGSLAAVARLTARPFVWTPYTTAALEQARTSHRIALVEFTADWCGNCQYVEAKVLHSNEIVSAVRQHDLLMLKADVTRDDAPARPLLETLNPAGSIPLTVIYSPHLDQPIELTGIYSKQDLQRAIDLAARSQATSVAQGS